MLDEVIKKSCIPVLLAAAVIVLLLALFEVHILESHARHVKSIELGVSEAFLKDVAPAPDRYLLPEETTGWALIVSSSKTLEEANTIADHFARSLRGVKIHVIEPGAGNTQAYRVTVGIFPEAVFARKALSRWGNSLPRGTWILNLSSL